MDQAFRGGSRRAPCAPARPMWGTNAGLASPPGNPAEAYPELKANQNFLMLQEELAGAENKLSYARQFYNDTVMQYNQAIQQFPGNVFAGTFNFTAKEYFEIEEAAREVPKVQF